MKDGTLTEQKTRKYQRRPSQHPFKTLSTMEVESNVYDYQRQKGIGYWLLHIYIYEVFKTQMYVFLFEM